MSMRADSDMRAGDAGGPSSRGVWPPPAGWPDAALAEVVNVA